MKKIILLGSVLYALTSAPANAQHTQLNFGAVITSGDVYEPYPRNTHWHRGDRNYEYWARIHREEEERERARLRAKAYDDEHRYVDNDRHDRRHGKAKGHYKNHNEHGDNR